MRGDIIAAGVIILVGAFLLATLFGFLDSDSHGYDAKMEYEDWMEYDTTGILGTEGPIEVSNGMLHAVGAGDARIVKEDGSVYRIRIVPAKADLLIMDGQSNAAYFYADETLAPAPELGKAFYYGFSNSMPHSLSVDITNCKLYDFIDPSTMEVRVGDKGPEMCRTWTEESGNKAIWISLGIPGRRIAEWDVDSGAAWQKNCDIMDAVNEILKGTDFDIQRTVVMWSQGESDFVHNTGYEHYMTTWTAFHDAANEDWGRKIDGWYLMMGRTLKVGWVNDCFAELAEGIPDVHIGIPASMVDSFTMQNGLLESDNLHYSQRAENALGNSLARLILGVHGVAPIYLVQATLDATVGEQATAPGMATCYRTDNSRIHASVSWDSAPDTSAPGVFAIEGTTAIQGVMEFAPPPVLVVTVTEATP